MQGRLIRRRGRAGSATRLAALLIAATLAFVLRAAPAEAQSWSWMPSWVPPWALTYVKNVGAGLSVVRVIPSDDKFDSTTTVGVTVGFAPQVGWGFVLGLGSFRAKVRTNDVEIGRVGVSPLLGGIGSTWVRDRLALKTSVAAGIVFNRAVSINHALLAQISGPATVEVSNSFGARLTFGAEYALAPKLGLRGAFNYTPLRPSFVVRSPQGETRGTWNATNVSLQVAFVVYPLR